MAAVTTGPRGTPKYTLLWDIIPWVEDYLRQPDGDRAGEPFEFTGEQIRFLQWFWAVDEKGRWLYRRGVLERCKGWGKDPVGAVIAAVELCGPSRVDFIDEDGFVYGKPDSAPWVIVAAVSESQTQNTMMLFQSLFNDAAVEKYKLDFGQLTIYAKAIRGKLQAVTSSPRSLEGNRGTFYLRNETHHWLANNGGHRMAEVLNRNMIKRSKFGAHMLDITNAPMPGEDSVHEMTYDEWQKAIAGKIRAEPILFDSREADPQTDVTDYDSLYRGISEAAGDATWLDIEATIQDFWSPSTGSESVKRRFYLNQKVTPSDAWMDAQAWDACERADVLEPGENIVLGFDGSRRNDSTALVACRVEDGLVVPIDVWEKPPFTEEWEIDRSAVDGAVAYAFATYNVKAFFADVNEWESYIEKWSDEYRTQLDVKASNLSSVGWDMRQRERDQTMAYHNMEAAIYDGTFKHNGDHTLRRHVLNAKRKLNQYGVIPRKEHRESARKIDALAATMLARMARTKLLEAGKGTTTQSRALVFG